MAEKDILLKSGKDILYPITKGANVTYGSTDSGVTIQDVLPIRLEDNEYTLVEFEDGAVPVPVCVDTDVTESGKEYSIALAMDAIAEGLKIYYKVVVTGVPGDLVQTLTLSLAPNLILMRETDQSTHTWGAWSVTSLIGTASLEDQVIESSSSPVKSSALYTAFAGKQDTLVSGTNIKTINNTSLLGSGDITVDSLPAQTGQSGKFLTTDGSSASWSAVDIPTGIYTRTNLLGSENISIDKVINPNVLDPETTLACFHFDGDATNVMNNGIDLSDTFKSCIVGYTDGVTYPWYNGKKALIFRPTSNNRTEFNMLASSITGIGTTGDFTVEFRVMRPSYSAPDVLFCAGPYYTNVCFNVASNESVFKTQPSNWGVQMNTNQWYHVVMVRKNGYISLYTPERRWEHTNSVSSNFTNVGMVTYGYNSNVIYIAELCVWNFAKYDGETLVSPTSPYEMSATGSTYNINATGLATTSALEAKQDALVSGTNIKTINSNSLLGSGNITIDSLPSQTGNSGKFLTTDGSAASWATVQTGDPLPSQTGQAGKFLTTDGTDASWAEVEVPTGIYTRTNLLGGANVSIDKVINPNVLDPETTLACFHFDGDTNNVMNNGIELSNAFKAYITGYSDVNTYPWYEGKRAAVLVKDANYASVNLFSDSITGIGTANDYTIEMRIRSVSSSYPIVYAGPSHAYPTIDVGETQISSWNSGSSRGSSVSKSTTTWYHLALVRHNGTTKAYINGTAVASSAEVNNIDQLVWYLGSGNNGGELHLAELVLTKEAKWTSNFTVPTTPYALDPEGSEYEINADLSSKQDTLVSGTNIKTVNGTSLLGSGDVAVTTYQPFPAAWSTYTTSSYTTEEFCHQVVTTASAVKGMAYLGELRVNDLPEWPGGIQPHIINAEAVVEVIDSNASDPTDAESKILHIVITSGNIAPYRWECTYWFDNGTTHNYTGWIGYQTALPSGTAGQFLQKTASGTQWANLPTVDQTYSGTSTNAQSGVAVKSAIDTAVSSVYKPAGSVAFASLPTLSASVLGNVYNVTDSFTTTADFVEGAGNSYPAGTNVVVVEPTSGTYKFDVLAGFVDLSGYQQTATAVTHTESTAAGSATQPVYIAADGTATATTYSLAKSVPADAVFTDTTYSAFTGTDGSDAGAAGLVPAPASTDANKYLKSDGTWATVASGDSLPDQTGQSGKFLTTNGTTASWGSIPAPTTVTSVPTVTSSDYETVTDANNVTYYAPDWSEILDIYDEDGTYNSIFIVKPFEIDSELEDADALDTYVWAVSWKDDEHLYLSLFGSNAVVEGLVETDPETFDMRVTYSNVKYPSTDNGGGSTGVTPTVVSFTGQTSATLATGLTLADYEAILVYKNGVLQRETTVDPASTNDYSISTNNIVFTSALVATDVVTIVALGEVSSSLDAYLTKTEAASTYATQASTTNMVTSTDIHNIVLCTQAEYDAMEQAGTLVSTTWYLIRAAQSA